VSLGDRSRPSESGSDKTIAAVNIIIPTAATLANALPRPHCRRCDAPLVNEFQLEHGLCDPHIAEYQEMRAKFYTNGAEPATAVNRDCDYWVNGGYCGNPKTRRYINGWRCAAHTPAAIAGRTDIEPDPDLTLAALQGQGRAARCAT
jgi:hypothetical protein